MRDLSRMSAEELADEDRWFADQDIAHARILEANERGQRARRFEFRDDDLPIDTRWDREREDREMR